MATWKDKRFKLKFYEGIPTVSAFLSVAGPMRARRPSSSECVIQQSSPKFSIPRVMRFVLYTQHYAIEWIYWQIDFSELTPTAEVIKNLLVIASFSTSDSEDRTTLKMKWYLAVTQDMSSMTLEALKQVERQSWMLSRASYSTGQQQSICGNSYMQYGEWLHNDTQMCWMTACLGTVSQ